MQKKKKKIAASKTKSIKKATVKPIVKKAAKKLAVSKRIQAQAVLSVEKVALQVVQKSKKPSAHETAAAAVVDKPRIDTKSFTEEQLDNYKKWLKFQKQFADKAPESYNMSGNFDVKTPLQHKIHGWGVVVQRRDNYIDVLFEAGLKTLIVNYKNT